MEQYRNKNQKKLRCGITTGTCSCAAVYACVYDLLGDVSLREVSIMTPKKELVLVPVEKEPAEEVRYSVCKDSGDDPDVTNGVKICALVSKDLQGRDIEHAFICQTEKGTIYLEGGQGVGRVTLDGLEQQIGQAAINPVPRQMIFDAAKEGKNEFGYEGDLYIEISVPEGEELAKKTFNPNLGIVGGISILGTSGILEPMSEQAIIDTIEVQIRQLSLQGQRKLLLTPGNYGQSYVKNYLHLDLEKAVKCSNYIGVSFDFAVSYEMESVLLVGNIGKLIKLAAGIMNTHSRTADARCEIMAVHVGLCGGSREQIQKIMECINTEQMLDYLTKWDLFVPVLESIRNKIQEHACRRLGEQTKVAVILFSEKYGFLGGTTGYEEILLEFQ